MTNFTVAEWAGLLQGRAIPGDFRCGEGMPVYLHRKVQAVVDQRDELLAALELTRENLRACQATIHLCGGFDPAYVTDAQSAMKVADAAIAKAKGEQAHD